MDFPLSRAEVPDLLVRESSPSTNVELVELARGRQLAEYTTLVTTDQTAGRGRLDRRWVAPAETALAISVLLSPRSPSGAPLALDRYGWLTIAAGVAMTETVAALVPLSTGFKWPNDVLIADRKVCGVLAELVLERSALVMGAGLNLTMTTEQLPVPTATSLALAGAADAALDPDAVLASYLRRLRVHVDAYAAAGGDADASGLRDRARELCTTLGREVRVELPDGSSLGGVATDVDAAGRLEVRGPTGAAVAVAAGDVTHLRHSTP